MPHLVQRLSAEDVFVDFDISREVLTFQLTASIAKGEKHCLLFKIMWLVGRNGRNMCKMCFKKVRSC